MHHLLSLSRSIDGFARRLGQAVSWLIVVAAVISAGNAIIRKLFDSSSNAWLEAQWWLFAGAFLLAAPWTLAANEHIRIDILNSRFSERTRDVIDLVGHALFLLPMCLLLIWTSWQFFVTSYVQNEQSWNAGGLPQWPIKALIPFAFCVLFVQGLAEIIKRVAMMRGDLPRPVAKDAYHETVVGFADGAAKERVNG
jgi:TRAP-type mannitol/chloroaromatic compound transport system permease small subunit